MIVKELNEICKLVNVFGAIDEFTISKDGDVLGINNAKTLLVNIKYNVKLSEDIIITNIKGIMEALTKFPEDIDIEIVKNQLCIVKDYRTYEIPLKVYEESKFKLPVINKNDYQVIAENIDYKILNDLGKFRAQSLVDEYYYLYVIDNKLMFRVGNETSARGADIVGDTQKCTSNETIIFTMNLSECFKTISTNANINILFGKLMMIECTNDQYKLQYYLAPRIE